MADDNVAGVHSFESTPSPVNSVAEPEFEKIKAYFIRKCYRIFKTCGKLFNFNFFKQLTKIDKIQDV